MAIKHLKKLIERGDRQRINKFLKKKKLTLIMNDSKWIDRQKQSPYMDGCSIC